MENKRIGPIVDKWIAQEELPPRPGLKVLRRLDPFEGWDEDEIEAWKEYVSWFISKDHAVLLSIPKPAYEPNFWPEPDDAISFDYGSVDFQRLRGEFDKYRYKIRKILERIKDLAQTYSCISHDQGRRNIRQRYEDLLYKEFREKIVELAETYRKNKLWMDYEVVKAEIKENYANIRKCEQVWQKYAFEE